MNIFVTDPCPVTCAQNLDDKRVSHMPKECLEMLGMIVYSLINKYPFKVPLITYNNRIERFNTDLYLHPCSRWVRKSVENSWWLYRHTVALLEEYDYRFNKAYPYRIQFNCIQKLIGQFIIPTKKEPKSFQNSSIFQMNEYPDVFKSYKETMNYKWFYSDIETPIWTNRDKPKWAVIVEQKSINFPYHFDDDDLPF